MILVTSVLTLLLALVAKLFLVIGRPELSTHLLVPYFLMHATGAVCTYKEWVPESFAEYPKDALQWHILVTFILINTIPLINFLVTTFVMFPILIVSSYLQLQE